MAPIGVAGVARRGSAKSGDVAAGPQNCPLQGGAMISRRFKPLDLPAGRCAPALAALKELQWKERIDPLDYWIEFFDDHGPRAQAMFDLADCGLAKAGPTELPI